MTTTIWQGIAFVLVVAMFATIITVVLRQTSHQKESTNLLGRLNERVHDHHQAPMAELLQRVEAAEGNERIACAEMERIAAQLVQSDTNRRWLEKRVAQLTEDNDAQEQLLAVVGGRDLPGDDVEWTSLMHDVPEPEHVSTNTAWWKHGIPIPPEPEQFHGFDVDDKVQVIDVKSVLREYQDKRDGGEQ